jgi:hypothetical protein
MTFVSSMKKSLSRIRHPKSIGKDEKNDILRDVIGPGTMTPKEAEAVAKKIGRVDGVYSVHNSQDNGRWVFSVKAGLLTRTGQSKIDEAARGHEVNYDWFQATPTLAAKLKTALKKAGYRVKIESRHNSMADDVFVYVSRSRSKQERARDEGVIENLDTNPWFMFHVIEL